MAALYAQGGTMNIAALLDYVVIMLICAYGIAFFGGHLKQAQTSPALVWVKSKYPKAPKILECICIFVFAFKAVGLLKNLL